MKTRSGYGWVIFGLSLLFIPALNIIDLFPDFIAYFIIAGALSHGINKLPYFEEAQSAFVKLGIVNLCRIPAIILILHFRSVNYSDTDIYAMMTLIFGIFESIYLFPAISNLFDALFYLGGRSESHAILAPIKLPGKSRDPETVKRISFVFAGARAVLALLPELCLMSAVDKAGTAIISHPYAHLYPLVLTTCAAISLLIGIIWLVASVKYVRAIGKEGLYRESIDALVTDERRPEIENKTKLRRASFALHTMMLASVFTLEINFDNFGNVNILPHFIFAILLVSGIKHLTGKTKYTLFASIIAAGYTVVSLAGHGLLIAFLEKWNYTEIKIIEDAQMAYTPIIVLAAIEFALAATIIITAMLAMHNFVINNTKIPPTAEGYGIPDRDFHRNLSKKNLTYTALGILVTASKFALVLLNSGADYLFVGNAGGGVSTIVTTAIPWFGLLITILALLYTGSAFHFLGAIKDELRMKYQ